MNQVRSTKHNLTLLKGGIDGKTKSFVFCKPGPDTYSFHMNGITDTDTYSGYYFHSVANLPNSSGFLFPYKADLAREDDSLVINCIEKYFLYALGDDAETAAQVFQNLKAGWGVIKSTSLGDVLTHIYSGIELALTTGAAVKLMAHQTYTGFVLFGEEFQLLYLGELLEPAPAAELVAAFDDANPHTQALQNIFEKLNFPDDLARQNALGGIGSIHQLRNVILAVGFNINDLQVIKANATQLNFTMVPYLILNPHNVARVLNAMAGPESEDVHFPLHPSVMLQDNRRHRLLSAFGAYAPTFLIPGGRAMDLASSTFSYAAKQKGKKTGQVVTVSKMHWLTVPLEKAVLDLETVIAKKEVHSPFGTALVKRSSSVSLLREIEGESASAVLSALRKVAGVVVQAGEGGGRKRKADEQGGSAGKRAKVASAFDL
jgi:hypothetical protein